MRPFFAKLKEYWRRLSWLDLLSIAVAGGGLLSTVLALTGGVFNFLKYLSVLAGLYLLVRVIAWWRNELLWSLRNRLIIAYLFIAVVPVLLIVALAWIAGTQLYSQLGAYLLHEDIEKRIEMIRDISEHIAVAHRTLPAGVTQEESEKILAAQSHAVHDSELPKLEISFSKDTSLLNKMPGKGSFAGLLQQGNSPNSLSLTSLRAISTPEGERVITLRVPINPEFLASVAPDLGAIQLNIMERSSGAETEGVIYSSEDKKYKVAGRISARNRVLQEGALWLDKPVNAVSSFPAVFVSPDKTVEMAWPVLASFNARPSQLNQKIFASSGELRLFYLAYLVLAGSAFILIEAAAFATGFVLTRRITRAVTDLYRGTQYVQAGDYSHRVSIQQRDQLGELAVSFNKMTGSISELIEEESKRRKLENEISIAREVQNQLFPSTLPSVPGVEIEAICKAARSVSGDYYDFIQLSPTHVAIAIADISGKGISAALLMASLQAALRSQLLTPGSEQLSTAELVGRLNKHLARNTGEDRFATFLVAVYDMETRKLRYTNAGHLPGFCLSDSKSMHLDVGGMVLGIVEDYPYQEGVVEVPRDAVFIAYSDGLVEPENAYGEEFGVSRLEAAAQRVRQADPKRIATALMTAAEEWSGSPEQADDMTVIVAKLK
jgi:sigma-B regulation protein RsbU (phosphoserine phosphatase)